MHHKNINQTLNTFKKIIIGTAFIMVFLIFCIIFLSMTKTITGKGIVKPSNERLIFSPYSGHLQNLATAPNAKVKQGQTILTISSSILDNQRLELLDKINEAQSNYNLAKAQLDKARINPLPEYLQDIQMKTNIAQQKYEFYQQSFERAQRLYKKGSISKTTLAKTKISFYEAQANYSHVKLQLKSVKKGLAKSIIKTYKAEESLALAKLNSLQNKLKRLNKHISKGIITAPCDGTILLQPLNQGQNITKDSPLASIAPSPKKIIRANISQKDIQKVKQGQQVLCESIQYDKYKTANFTGIVQRIYSTAKNNYYLVDISIIKEPKELKFGSEMQVNIITGTQSIFMGLFDVLN